MSTFDSAPTVEAATTPPRSTWLLERLLTGPHRRLHPVASQVLGLLGLIVYTVGLAVVLSLPMQLTGSIDRDAGLLPGMIDFLACFCLYVTLLATAHWLALCQLSLSLRLAMIFAVIFLCVQIIVEPMGELVFGGQVFVLSALCWGGFLQQTRGWRALSWGQTLQPPKKLGVGRMLDVTAAIALTLAMLQTQEIEPQALICFVPGSLLLAFVGMHGWGRLTALCHSRHLAERGFAIWVTGHIMWSALILLAFAWRVGAIWLVLIPTMIILVQCTTGVAILWLKACGWRLERRDETLSLPTTSPLPTTLPRSPVFGDLENEELREDSV